MKKLKFLVSLTTDDNDYQIEQSESAEQGARKTGVEIQIVHAQNDAINQSTQLLKAVQSPKELRPDAIIFEPVGGTALPQVAKAAVSAGIGYVIRKPGTFVQVPLNRQRIVIIANLGEVTLLPDAAIHQGHLVLRELCDMVGTEIGDDRIPMFPWVANDVGHRSLFPSLIDPCVALLA